MKYKIGIFIGTVVVLLVSSIGLYAYHIAHIDNLITNDLMYISESEFVEALKNSKQVSYVELPGFTEEYEGEILKADAVYEVESAFVGGRISCSVYIREGETDGYFCLFNVKD